MTFEEVESSIVVERNTSHSNFYGGCYIAYWPDNEEDIAVTFAPTRSIALEEHTFKVLEYLNN